MAARSLVLKHLPGYETLTRAEEVARLMAFTPEEATAWARQTNGDSAVVPTSDAVVASLWEFVKRQAERWG